MDRSTLKIYDTVLCRLSSFKVLSHVTVQKLHFMHLEIIYLECLNGEITILLRNNVNYTFEAIVTVIPHNPQECTEQAETHI
jgi:hypothetical protein